MKRIVQSTTQVDNMHGIVFRRIGTLSVIQSKLIGFYSLLTHKHQLKTYQSSMFAYLEFCHRNFQMLAGVLSATVDATMWFIKGLLPFLQLWLLL